MRVGEKGLWQNVFVCNFVCAIFEYQFQLTIVAKIFLYSCAQEIIPLGTAVTVCQYAEDGNNFDATLRLSLRTKEEVIHWLEEFQAGSKTTLRKSKTFPHAGGKLLYKVNDSVCFRNVLLSLQYITILIVDNIMKS